MHSETVFRGEFVQNMFSLTLGNKTTCLISIISNQSTGPFSGIQLASRAGARSVQRILDMSTWASRDCLSWQFKNTARKV